jgi:SPX domain protein involved in polyphosphate accumulation
VSEAQDFRYERKFFLSGLSTREIEWIIKRHSALFREIHSERFVNNIYFDTPTLDYYYSNLEGDSERMKVRIRWYGDLEGKIAAPALELKSKRGNVGSKASYRLAEFEMGPDLDRRAALALFERSSLPKRLADTLHGVEPILVNRYRRRYFQSVDKRFRITLDADMEVRPVRAAGSRSLERCIDTHHRIVELKYVPDDDSEASRVTAEFPFRVTKSSKYAKGVTDLFVS